DFRPETYTTKGYYAKGSIRTNSHTLQVLCFKLRELLSVKYKRLPDDSLSPRLTPTTHGTGDFLSEIRNVLGTKEDVANLWPGIDPQNIKTLTLDAGQAYVVGGYAYLPRIDEQERVPFLQRLTPYSLLLYNNTTGSDANTVFGATNNFKVASNYDSV
ncbi:hypothetical protein BGZ80_009914, partial [Entomortierella chlamydospora]